MTAKVSRRALLAAPMLALLPTSKVFSQSGGWRPSRLVRIVVPQGPGGTTDVMARLLATYLQGRWGETIVVENKTGAGGLIGTQEVVRSAPDGLNVLMGNVGSQAIAFSLARNLPYKPDDLIPVSNMITGPNVLIANKEIPANNVREFAEYIKNNPGKVNFGTPGVGFTPHLAGIWFNTLLGTQSAAVHYRGSAAAMTDLLGGTIQYSFDALVNASAPIRAGTVKAFGVTGATRYPGLPELPTMRESMPELASFVSESWVGVFLPKGTPNEIVQAFNAEVRAFLGQSEIPARFLTLGGVPDYQTAEQFDAFVKKETVKWAEVVRSANLQVDY